MKTIKATCSSAFTAIKSVDSTKVLKETLLNLAVENKQYYISIFNKVKNLQPINSQEADDLLEIVQSDDFREAYREIKNEFFHIKKKHKDNFKYSRLLVGLTQMIYESHIISQLTDNKWELSVHGRKYESLELVQWKLHFYEYIDEYDNFFIYYDMRRMKFIVVNKQDNSILYESVNELFFSQEYKWEKLPDGFVFLWEQSEKSQQSEGVLLFDTTTIPLSKKINTYDGKFAHFVVDSLNNIIYKIEKRSWENSEIDYWSGNIEWVYDWYVLIFDAAIQYHWDDNMVHVTEWELRLFSLEKNKDVLHNISLKDYYYDSDSRQFICKSSDGWVLNYLNIATWKLREESREKSREKSS